MYIADYSCVIGDGMTQPRQADSRWAKPEPNEANHNWLFQQILSCQVRSPKQPQAHGADGQT